MYDGQFAACLELVEEALPAADRLALDGLRVRLLQLRGYASTVTGDEAGFADFRRAIALAKDVHDSEQLQSALNNLMARQVASGQLDKALETFDAMERNLEGEPSDARRRWVAVVGTDMEFMTGNWAEARRRADDHISKMDPASPHVLDPAMRHIRSSMLRAEGELGTPLEDAKLMLAAVEGSSEAQLVSVSLIGAGFAFLEAGRRDEAEELLGKALEFGERLVSVLNDTLIVETAWLAHDLGRDDDYVVLLRPWQHFPWAEAAEAVCAGEYRRAADVLERIGYRPGEAYARLRAAKQLVEEGRRAEADVELQASLVFWREVGAARYVREGEELLAASA
jgi:tetratricopeptide (TPR) repeat protein